MSETELNEIVKSIRTHYVLFPRRWVWPLAAAAVVVCGAVGWSIRAAMNAAASEQAIELVLQRANEAVRKDLVAGQMEDDRSQDASETWKMGGRAATYCCA